VVMLVIAVVGIKITAKTQVSMALGEYLILMGLALGGGSGTVAGRHRRRRSGADALRAVRAAVRVLRHPAGERRGLKVLAQGLTRTLRPSSTVWVSGSPGGRVRSQRASASPSTAVASVTRPTAR
jgi:hypothetical protein